MASNPAPDPDPPSAEETRWRTVVTWIVLHSDRSAVLVIDDHGSAGLPRTVLPGRVWLGDAPVLTTAIAGLGLDVVLLGCRERVDDLTAQHQRLSMLASPRAGAVSVATRRSPPSRQRRPCRPASVGPASTRWRTFHRRRQRTRRPGVHPGRSPPGSARPNDGCAIGSTIWAGPSSEQSNSIGCGSSPACCAPRHSTGAVWLKASAGSALFTDEGAVMAVLADWFPNRVPAPLAVDAERRLLLLDDLGPELDRRIAIEQQEQVLVRFSELQAATVGRLDILRATGSSTAVLRRSPSRPPPGSPIWTRPRSYPASIRRPG